MIHQYQYKPEIVIAHFANFERLYFVSDNGEAMHEWFINHKPKKTKARLLGIMKKFCHMNGFTIKILIT